MQTGTFTGEFSDVMRIITEYDVILKVKGGIPIVIPTDMHGYSMCLLTLIDCTNVFSIPVKLYSKYSKKKIDELIAANQSKVSV